MAVRNIRSELCSFPFQFRFLRKDELCAWTNPYSRNSWKSVERQIRRYLEIQAEDADIKSPIQIPIKISALSLSTVPYLTTQILTGDSAKITFFIIFIQAMLDYSEYQLKGRSQDIWRSRLNMHLSNSPFKSWWISRQMERITFEIPVKISALNLSSGPYLIIRMLTENFSNIIYSTSLQHMVLTLHTA